MITEQKPQPAEQEVAAWLATFHNAPIEDLAPLAGGFWSSAYAYRIGAQDLVLRLGHSGEGYAIDQAAMRFTSAALPVPEVLAAGTALDLHFAISRRLRGDFIETRAQACGDAVGGAMAHLLAGLRAAPAQPGEPVDWYDENCPPGFTWHDWLRRGITDRPDSHSAGWRQRLAADARLDALFRACEERISVLLPDCPLRRDLVHSDLLHQNVLVGPAADRVTGIFSWKCSARGDFLYDVAWCTFWGPWHPAIAAGNLWERTWRADDLTTADLHDAPLRHHCYELQIAASHLGWSAWTGVAKDLADVAAATEHVLARGPLSTPVP